jgi:hypothetical protein
LIFGRVFVFDSGQTPLIMKINFFLTISFLLLCSCTAPRVVTKIKPEAPEGYFANGREYIPLVSDHISVELGFDGMQEDYLIFDLVIHNASADTLSILPGSFYYVVLDSANGEAFPDTSWMAVHPDRVIMYYDEVLEDRKKAKGVNTFLGILQASVDILYSTSGFIATEDPGFIADAVINTVGTADLYISQDKKISTEMELISEEKTVVEEVLFRKCRIPPGETGTGFVYFPRHDHTPYYMFCFPIEKELFQFVYSQQRTYEYY